MRWRVVVRWLAIAARIYLATVAINMTAWFLEATGFNPRKTDASRADRRSYAILAQVRGILWRQLNA